MDIKVYDTMIKKGTRESILREIYNDIRFRGVTAEEWKEWQSVACPFPHLRFIEPVKNMAWNISRLLDFEDEVGDFCEPQFIFHFPDDPDIIKQGTWHIDSPPPWADGRGYAKIIGVALNDWFPENGALRVWPGDSEESEPIPYLAAGDAIEMNPQLRHASGVNETGEPRIGMYLRWLEE